MLSRALNSSDPSMLSHTSRDESSCGVDEQSTVMYWVNNHIGLFHVEGATWPKVRAPVVLMSSSSDFPRLKLPPAVTRHL